MRNINVCILLQLVLNCIIANGNHQRLLYISPKRNGRELTDCAELQIAPSSVHLKTRCGAENLVPLAGNREIFKKHQERTMSFDWLFETFRISRGERFQSHLLGGTLLHVFLLSIQYLLDNTWIVMCGDISHVVWLFSDYLPQQPSHDDLGSGFRKVFHHLQRRERCTYIRTWVLLENTRKFGWTVLSWHTISWPQLLWGSREIPDHWAHHYFMSKERSVTSISSLCYKFYSYLRGLCSPFTHCCVCPGWVLQDAQLFGESGPE